METVIGTPVRYRRDIQGVATQADYHTFEVPKFKTVRGKRVQKGVRKITAPNRWLKDIQKNITRELQAYGIGIHNCAHAYRYGKSITTMAEKHVGKKYVLRIDLSDFFSSITAEMVRSYLPKGVPLELKRQITKWCFLDGKLPQGAPSSPLLSNIAFFSYDARIARIVQSWRSFRRPNKISPHKIRFHDITYSRYSDDLVFSSDYPFLYDIVPLLELVLQPNFKINHKKTRFAKSSSKQQVTGIVVNKKLSVARDSRKLLRAELHKLTVDIVTGRCPNNCRIDETGNIVPINPAHIDTPLITFEGKVSHIANVCPEQATSLQKQLRILSDVINTPADQWSDETLIFVTKLTDG